MSTKPFDEADVAPVIRAFERLASAALRADAPAEQVLEAAAMGVALAELGLVERAADAPRVAARARKVLLGAADLRTAASDEDARDALDLAIEQARRGAALLAGGRVSTLDGARALEPTPHEIARLVRGELDGHAAADVALRLHRSGGRGRFAAFLPGREDAVDDAGVASSTPPASIIASSTPPASIIASSTPPAWIRLAADSAPQVRDPATGRALGRAMLGAASLEAFAFEDGVIAIYAEPAIALTLVSIDAPLAGRAIEAAGYLELRVVGEPETLVLVLADGEDRAVDASGRGHHVRWSFPLR